MRVSLVPPTAALDPIAGDANVAYALHFYAGTHRQSLRDKAAFALERGVALFVTVGSQVAAPPSGPGVQAPVVLDVFGAGGSHYTSDLVAVNRRNYEAYRAGLAGIPGVALMPYDSAERGNYQYVVVEVDEATAGLTRDDLIKVLHAENVLARKYFWPGCHRMSANARSRLVLVLLAPNALRRAGRPRGGSTGVDDGPSAAYKGRP